MRSQPVHILLVEDNAADVFLFHKALAEAELKFELTVIGDGAEALAFLEFPALLVGLAVSRFLAAALWNAYHRDAAALTRRQVA